MPPKLVLLLGFAYIGWMLVMERRWRRLPSNALWIPAFWLAMSSSRPMEFWLAQLGVVGAQQTSLEGSPVNVIFNGGLLLGAVLVLNGRGFRWGQFFSANKSLSALYAFLLCSMAWSPYPVPTVKRVVQDFGCVLTGLVLLTEKDPAASLRVVFVRLSYILFPLSVIFIRYFPEIGRVYSNVTGVQFLTGVAGHKNLLGQMTMVYCWVLLWDLMETRKERTASGSEPERWVRLLNLGIGLYLLVISRSATSWICFLLGVVLLVGAKRLARMENARQIVMGGALAVVTLLTLEGSFGIAARISEALGRGSGLSGRTLIWQAILDKSTGIIAGAGFMGFWETSEGESVWREIGMTHLVTAHNGYLETYLHGGVLGLFFLGAFLWTAGLNATDKLIKGNPIGVLAVVFWPILLIYNVTETAFFVIGSLWFTTLLVVVDSPWQARYAAANQERELRRDHHGSTEAKRPAQPPATGESWRGSLPKYSQTVQKHGVTRTIRSRGHFRRR